MKIVPFFLLFLVIASAAALGIIVKNPRFETSLEALAGKDMIAVPAAVRSAVSSRVQVIASSASFRSAVDLAGEFVARIGTDTVKELKFRVDARALPEVLGFYRRHRGGMMSPGDKTAAADGRLAGIVAQRLSSLSPSLFGFQDDPFRFLDDFVKTLPQGFGSWRMKDGVLAAEKDGRYHVLVSFALPDDCAFDIERLPVVLGPIIDICRELNGACASAELSVSGVPVHTLETSGRCERQIALLCVFSFSFVVLLALWIFRSLKAVALVAANLALASAAGFAAVNLSFDRVHLLSLVFGTALVGLAVDYSFHSLLTGGARREVRANLLKSFFTTLAGFLPLAFSGIDVLAQMALFLSVGLSVSLVYNLTVPDADRFSFPETFSAPSRFPSALNWVPLLLAVLSVAGFFFADFRTEARDLHSPSARLAAAERLSAGLSGIEADSGMALVKGKTLEEALVKEERLFPDRLCLSKFVPSCHVREANYALMKDFHEKHSASVAEKLGTENVFPAPAKPLAIAAHELPRSLAGQFLFAGDGSSVVTLVPALPRKEAAKLHLEREGVDFYAPAAVLAEMLGTYGRRAGRLLMLSFAMLAALLFFFYRRRSPMVLLPSVLGVATMFFVVSATGGNVNFFHLLAAFMVVGMAIDYTVFLAGDFRNGFKAVVCSLLTSLAGFGALAFVSFPVVSSLGSALAVGLPVSFLSAVALFRPRDGGDERAATPLGLELSFLVYRLFGRKALDIVAAAVANAVWIFDGKARKAAASRRRLVNFALSLGDKIAVLSMGKDQPEVKFDESPDAGEFIENVTARKGVVVISSHLGNIETLAAYGECAAEFHVFMALDRTNVFRAFKERHARRSRIEVHPTEGFGMAELFLGASIVERGDVVLIAGDRGGGRRREMAFCGGTRRFPEGAFRFAGHLERPVYFVASVREKSGYRVFVKRLPQEDMLGVYVRELERLAGRYPEQWYQWEGEAQSDG